VLLFGFDAAGSPRGCSTEWASRSSLSDHGLYDGLPQRPERLSFGGCCAISGDRFQSSKFLDGHRYWRIP